MSSVTIEYARKANVLLVLVTIAMIMLSIFAVLSYIEGDVRGALVNLVVLGLVLVGFVLLRYKKNLTFASYVLAAVLALQFFSDFAVDTNAAMWSYTIPIFSFFLLGMRSGAILSGLYLIASVVMMTWLYPEQYAMGFKVRFPAIYLSIAFFTFIYEKSRMTAQNFMEIAQRDLERDKNKLVESDRALQYFKSLIEGKTITLSEAKERV